MAIGTTQLIDAAVIKGLIERETVSELQTTARHSREDILDLITGHGQFPRSSLYRAYAEEKNLTFVDLDNTQPVEEYVHKLPESFMRRRQVLPVDMEGNAVIVASVDPHDRSTSDLMKRVLNSPVRFVLAEPKALQLLIEQTLAKIKRTRSAVVTSQGGAVDSSAAMDQMMKEAFLRRSSDIHLEPQENYIRIRFRVDGALLVFNMGLDLNGGISMISRIKVLSGLDIAEQRLPQDGGFTYDIPQQTGKKIDIRVATAPTRWGERVTMRLLGIDTGQLTLEYLGMSERNLERFSKVIQRPHGVILMTGPTGSGKTTTLYGALRQINDPKINLMTIEDPIEYVVPGINQFQVGEGTKSTFSTALRSLLRHDPDVLMVGEIRDYETADIALKASLTGHLVFSTLHTNSAVSAVTRLIDIGCERYLIASSLTAVIAQRLVRKLCGHCAKSRAITGDEAGMMGINDCTRKVFEPKGCVHCSGTGFRGRIGLFECMWLDADMRDHIAQGVTEKELFDYASNKELVSLRGDGYAKVLSGKTTLEEIYKVTIEEYC